MEQLTDKDRYKRVAVQIAELVTEKNAAYGDSFAKSSKILEILYPNGIRLKDYQNVLFIIRIIDKLFRISTDKNSGKEDSYADICGYGLLKVTENANKK